MSDGPATCGRCGRQEARPPLTWSREVDERGVRLLCDDCTRENVRAIEGRLAEQWW